MSAPETTEALVERVREWYGAEMTPPEALATLADRVKELERERDEAFKWIDVNRTRAERAEAEVLRLREALHRVSNASVYAAPHDVREIARAALSEEPRT